MINYDKTIDKTSALLQISEAVQLKLNGLYFILRGNISASWGPGSRKYSSGTSGRKFLTSVGHVAMPARAMNAMNAMTLWSLWSTRANISLTMLFCNIRWYLAIHCNTICVARYRQNHYFQHTPNKTIKFPARPAMKYLGSKRCYHSQGLARCKSLWRASPKIEPEIQ